VPTTAVIGSATMKKFTVVLGMLGVFALGCATASVLIDTAEATPPTGSQQCASFMIPWVGENEIAKNKHEEKGTWLPAGWTPVGGATVGSAPAVVACRTAP
jgi:uncharacterized membrane protein YedE/YeeE